MLDTPSPRDRFAACLAVTLRWEGGWSNHPADPGGATMKGVIQTVYDGWRDAQGLQRRSVRLIDHHEVEAIYRQNYWDVIQAAKMPAGVDLAAFDQAVNSGPTQAARSLQRVLGVAIDGHIGSETLGAIAKRDPAELVQAYVEERRRFFRSLRHFATFGRGWLNRCDGIETAALGMARPTEYGIADHIPQVTPSPNPNEQAASQAKAPTQAPTPPKGTELALGTTGTTGIGGGIAKGFAEVGKMAEPTTSKIMFAFLSQELLWVGVICLVCTFTVYLWRKKFA